MPIYPYESYLFLLLLVLVTISSLCSVAPDEQQADAGDDERRREAELEVAEEGEGVAKLLGPARLLAHDQVRRRPQQRQVAGHRAHPRQDQPRVGLRRRGDRRRRGRHPCAEQ